MPEKKPAKKVQPGRSGESKATPRKRAAKNAPPKAKHTPAQPAPKSGAVALNPAVLASFVQAMAPPPLPQPPPGQAFPLGVIAGTDGPGPGPTSGIGAGAVDLCEISPGGQVALGGDTFAGNAMGAGAWSPSMGLHVRPGTLNSDQIQFDRSFGGGGSLYADPGLPGGSQLPAGTVQGFGVDYALV